VILRCACSSIVSCAAFHSLLAPAPAPGDLHTLPDWSLSIKIRPTCYLRFVYKPTSRLHRPSPDIRLRPFFFFVFSCGFKNNDTKSRFQNLLAFLSFFPSLSHSLHQSVAQAIAGSIDPTMSPTSWPETDGSPQPSHQDVALDRQMVRHLLSRYPMEQLQRLFQEEQIPPGMYPSLHFWSYLTLDSASDQASIVSSSATSVMSDAPSSVWDTGSVRSFSDTTSIAGSIFSNVSSKTSKILNRRNQTSSLSATQAAQAATCNQTQSPAQHQPSSGGWTTQDVASQSNNGSETLAAGSTATKQKGAFMCGFCKEEDIVKTCTRKNDLKRHIEDFHNMDAQWFCRHRGCQMVFDWQTAYKTHLKQAHGGSRMSLDEAKVNLCPQVVFACGFENCLQVFEAPNDAEAPQTFKEYVSHVVKHFDESANSGEWTYSARMRNLLRQNSINQDWNNSGYNEAARSNLQWQPQNSGILRKRLECRHIGDIKLLLQYAYLLGSNQPLNKFREDFVTPIADECTMNIPGHKGCQQPAVAAAAAAAVTPVQEPADPFQFRISRGTNPQLAAYMASQRRIYVPRQQRPMSRQSQHHPQHQQHHASRHQITSVPTSNPMANGHYFTSLPEHTQAATFYDPSASQPFSPATSIMHQGGIIADDIQSLRSMANGTPDHDVNMSDTPLLTDLATQFVTHSRLQSPAGASGLSSPAGLDHNGHFYHHDDPTVGY
jgi:hypothetical protein